MVTAGEYMEREFVETDYVVKYLVDEKGICIVAGDTGSGKSWVGLQMGLSISTGSNLFDFFDVKQEECCLVQFENGDFNQQKRLRKMTPHFPSDWKKNLKICPLKPKNKVFIDNWKLIRETLIKTGFRDGVLIVDNMYTSTDIDIHNPNECKKLMALMHDIRTEFNLTIICIAHTNKTYNNITELHHDQIQGGATLMSFSDNGMMIHQSSLGSGLRFAKIIKAGRNDDNPLYKIPFKMHWDAEKGLFTKGVIIHNEALHFLPPTERFEDRLIKDIALGTEIEHLPYFTREQFISNIPEDDAKDYKYPEQITRLLNLFQTWGYIKKIAHNKYKADLQAIDDLVVKDYVPRG